MSIVSIPSGPPDPRDKVCAECNGSGVKFGRGGKTYTCPKCGGSGR